MENSGEPTPNGNKEWTKRKYRRVPRLDTPQKRARLLENTICEVREFAQGNPKLTLVASDVQGRLMRTLHSIHMDGDMVHNLTEKLEYLEERLQQVIERWEAYRRHHTEGVG